MPFCACTRPKSWSQSVTCACTHNVHAKAVLLPQWFQPISLTTIKNIFPNHLNPIIAYSAHPGFSQGSPAWVLQCLKPQLNSLFSTSLPVQYWWFQQTKTHGTMVTYARHSFGDLLLRYLAGQIFHYPSWEVDRVIVKYGIAHIKTGIFSAQTNLLSL